MCIDVPSTAPLTCGELKCLLEVRELCCCTLVVATRRSQRAPYPAQVREGVPAALLQVRCASKPLHDTDAAVMAPAVMHATVAGALKGGKGGYVL